MVVCGVWGAVVPFVGPSFGYRSHGQAAWQWSSMHAVVYLAPGLVAALFGLIILGLGFNPARIVIGLAGFIVVACGAWFVFSPALWPTFGTGAVFEPARTAIGNFGNQFGYNLAVGVLLIALGGMAMKPSVPDRYPLVVIDEPMIDAEFVAVAADAANGAASVADVADVA